MVFGTSSATAVLADGGRDEMERLDGGHLPEDFPGGGTGARRGDGRHDVGEPLRSPLGILRLWAGGGPVPRRLDDLQRPERGEYLGAEDRGEGGVQGVPVHHVEDLACRRDVVLGDFAAEEEGGACEMEPGEVPQGERDGGASEKASRLLVYHLGRVLAGNFHGVKKRGAGVGDGEEGAREHALPAIPAGGGTTLQKRAHLAVPKWSHFSGGDFGTTL